MDSLDSLGSSVSRQELQRQLSDARAFAREMDNAKDRFAWESGATGLSNRIDEVSNSLNQLVALATTAEASEVPEILGEYNNVVDLSDKVSKELNELRAIANLPYRRFRFPKIKIEWNGRNIALSLVGVISLSLITAIAFAPRDNKPLAGPPAALEEVKSTYLSVGADERKQAEYGVKFDARSGSFVTAKRGSQGTAYDGSNVFAQAGSKVTARLGSVVYADDDSQVFALDGSEVFAKQGAKVQSVQGAKVQTVESFPAFVR
jgi:hypothetical protein